VRVCRVDPFANSPRRRLRTNPSLKIHTKQPNLQVYLASLPDDIHPYTRPTDHIPDIMPTRTFEQSIIDLMQAVGLLVRRTRNEAHAAELSMTESVVMSRLANDGPATTAALARAEGMKPQSMGATIASLEEMGIVKRTPHVTDGRQMLIELTPKGVRLRKKNREAKQMWLSQMIAALDPEERDTLFKAAGIIRRLAEK
jgi:DNA-binding MarR family transcriptional regulator